MEDFFLNLGFSWTLSKLLPYLICFLIGLVVFFMIRKRMKSGLIRKLMIVVIVIPFGIYFALNPIYQGDFSNDYNQVTIVPDSLNLNENTLTVIAIPNCPYCAEAMERLNKLMERSEKKSFHFIVLSSDSTTTDVYRKMNPGPVSISNDPDFGKYEAITQGQFPTYIYRNSKGIYVWSNDVFGVRAADWVEEQLGALK